MMTFGRYCSGNANLNVTSVCYELGRTQVALARKNGSLSTAEHSDLLECYKWSQDYVFSRDWVDSKPALSSTPIHNYERNLVQVPFDVVQTPIADIDLLDVMSYASVGSIIGHEVTHAFDEQGGSFVNT
ncbi:hypothetical protein ANCDUO_15587 [Ancylostoma duodenale]|uniref:Peptidase M13 C-terminal domain-containing protein n=1 Tax=Ancylostoma duodenale TaxID=51022 RepID=A0A0C2CD64_9BILA|nr:hypothetical protein ANCDUO_15587 [Ancylostoma duodenale]